MCREELYLGLHFASFPQTPDWQNRLFSVVNSSGGTLFLSQCSVQINVIPCVDSVPLPNQFFVTAAHKNGLVPIAFRRSVATNSAQCIHSLPVMVEFFVVTVTGN
ncbi:hypothetical protein BaRGS_00029247 [Batillaria attramentaria]|uniref:Uncharacterized protein n=1 Tax=Batillaria attramentaria TaxID=370345 RepID=A0ABD0JY88_9CAEN